MNKTITAPQTVTQAFRLAEDLGIRPSTLFTLLGDALGENWWDREPEDFEIILTDPRSIPVGFKSLDQVIDTYQGKSMDGERWTVLAEWDAPTDTFSLTFWTSDDESMTASETLEYASALLEMTAYLADMEALRAPKAADPQGNAEAPE